MSRTWAGTSVAHPYLESGKTPTGVSRKEDFVGRGGRRWREVGAFLSSYHGHRRLGLNSAFSPRYEPVQDYRVMKNNSMECICNVSLIPLFIRSAFNQRNAGV